MDHVEVLHQGRGHEERWQGMGLSDNRDKSWGFRYHLDVDGKKKKKSEIVLRFLV